MGFGKRFSDAIEAGRAAVRARELAQAASPRGPEAQAPSLGALAVGLSAEEVAECVPAIRAAARRDDAHLILITDRTDIALFKLPGFVTEYLAPMADLANAAPERDAGLYLRRRIVLIRRKWNLRSILYFGETAAAFARKWGSGAQELSPELFVSGMHDDRHKRA